MNNQNLQRDNDNKTKDGKFRKNRLQGPIDDNFNYPHSFSDKTVQHTDMAAPEAHREADQGAVGRPGNAPADRNLASSQNEALSGVCATCYGIFGQGKVV